jgi:hypothetical protein
VASIDKTKHPPASYRLRPWNEVVSLSRKRDTMCLGLDSKRGWSADAGDISNEVKLTTIEKTDYPSPCWRTERQIFASPFPLPSRHPDPSVVQNLTVPHRIPSFNICEPLAEGGLEENGLAPAVQDETVLLRPRLVASTRIVRPDERLDINTPDRLTTD